MPYKIEIVKIEQLNTDKMSSSSSSSSSAANARPKKSKSALIRGKGLYNSYVARNRQKKYFAVKKSDAKWRRQRKHLLGDEADDNTGGTNTNSDMLLDEDEDEREDNLAFPTLPGRKNKKTLLDSGEGDNSSKSDARSKVKTKKNK